MMGKAVQVQIDHAAFAAALGRLAAATQNPAPVLAQIGEYLRNSTSDRFKSQTGPDGAPWQALSQWYRDGKAKNADKILTLDGNLRRIVYQVSSDEVQVGSPMEYAAIHQFGGVIKPARAKALKFGGGYVASVTMPARPFLGVSDDDAVEVASLVSDYLAGALDG